MATENLENAPKKRIFIHLPKHHMAGLSKYYNLDHGLFITQLNPNVSERYLTSYFKEWGTVTLSKVKNCSSSSKYRLAYVRFSTEEEADRADWAGPHYIGGTECKVRRVVGPKIQGEPENVVIPVQSKAPPRRSMGLGYMLEDSQWLEGEDENKEASRF